MMMMMASSSSRSCCAIQQQQQQRVCVRSSAVQSRSSSSSSTFLVSKRAACTTHASPQRLTRIGASKAADQQPASKSAAAAAVPDVLVEEVMNPHPVLLLSTMTMKEAAHKMLEANVAGAPVVDAAGALVGVLSESDLIWKGAGAPDDHFIIPPVYIGIVDAFVSLRESKKVEEEVAKILARTVGDAMVNRERVVSASPDTPLSDAARRMLHHDINLLPVVEGSERRVVGVVTRHDVLRGIYASENPLL